MQPKCSFTLLLFLFLTKAALLFSSSFFLSHNAVTLRIHQFQWSTMFTLLSTIGWSQVRLYTNTGNLLSAKSHCYFSPQGNQIPHSGFQIESTGNHAYQAELSLALTRRIQCLYNNTDTVLLIAMITFIATWRLTSVKLPIQLKPKWRGKTNRCSFFPESTTSSETTGSVQVIFYVTLAGKIGCI